MEPLNNRMTQVTVNRPATHREEFHLLNMEPKIKRPAPKAEEIKFNSLIATVYLNPCLLLQEETNRVPKDTRFPPQVDDILESLRCHLQTTTGMNIGTFNRLALTGGELTLCGSMAEGTKVGVADEFDYQYLLTPDNLVAEPKRLLRTKPCSGNYDSRSCFTLFLPDDTGSTAEVKASEIQDAFLEKVRSIINEISDKYEVKKAGPAVKISFFNDTGHRIKIDLTLGLRYDPKQLTYLTELAQDLDGKGRLKCHFVAAHDYWKICFVDTEQDLLREMIEADEFKGAVYRIIKLLRDEADIKDPYGDGILPSYPIKVTFMDIAHQYHEKGIKWSIQDVTFHVIKILREVERRGQSHILGGLFMEEYDVVPEADRSYLECRRLLNKLKAKERFYCKIRWKMILFMILTCICNGSFLMMWCLVVATKHVPLLQATILYILAWLVHILSSVFPITAFFYTIELFYLWIVKSKYIFKVYPGLPVVAAVVFIFNHIPLLVVHLLDVSYLTSYNSTLLERNASYTPDLRPDITYTWLLWTVTAVSLGVTVLSIIFFNALKGTVHKKVFIVLDETLLNLSILRPYKWRSPSNTFYPYMPEFGEFNTASKLLYFFNIIMSLFNIFLTISLLVIFEGSFYEESIFDNHFIAGLIGYGSIVQSSCIVALPFILYFIQAMVAGSSVYRAHKWLDKHVPELMSTYTELKETSPLASRVAASEADDG